MKTAVATGRRAFASEIKEAARLGFRLQVRIERGALANTAYARLVPQTPRARALCSPNVAIEGNQVFAHGYDMVDALREAIAAAMTFAKDAAA